MVLAIVIQDYKLGLCFCLFVLGVDVRFICVG